jgi:UDP-glucose 4-epimerase
MYDSQSYDVDASYQGLRVLVLGGTGFIGWNLVRRLCQAGAEVTALDRRQLPNPNEPQSWGLEPTDRKPQVVVADLNDPQAVRQSIVGQQVIWNVAGRSGALSSNRQPLADLEANCRGVLHVLEACRQENPEARLVFPGSRLQYGPPQYLPVDDMHPMEPVCIYGVHKLTGEKYHQLYHHLYGLPTTVLRISNPYGPSPLDGQKAYNIVNHFVRQAMHDGPLRIFGDGKQLRDYVYIADLVDIMLLAGIHPGAIGQAFNVGGGQPVAFMEMAQAIIEEVGGGRIEQVPWPTEHEAVETGDFFFDIEPISQALGWRPRTDLREGIQRTAHNLRNLPGRGA